MKKTAIVWMLFSVILTGQTTSERFQGQIKNVDHKTFMVTSSKVDSQAKYHHVDLYSKNQQLLSELFYGDDHSIDLKKTYYYNKNGFCTKVETFKNKQLLDNILTYEYNDRQKLVLEKKTNHKGNIQYQTNFLYGTSGLLDSKQQWFTGIDYSIKEFYTYNKNGLLDKMEKTTLEGTVTELYKYNTQNQLTDQAEYNTAGVLFSMVIYTYNERGDKKALYKYNSDGNLTYFEQYEYEYDAKGNWVIKTNFEKGEMVSVERRKLTYY